MASEGETMEVKMTTRERIVIESLKLFAKKGYDGVSMREIAAAVGIKGASLYNHFKGKEDIFHAIFTEMTTQYDSAAMMANVPLQEDEQAVQTFQGIKEEQLLAMAEGIFSFFTQNEFAVLFRRFLVSEQNRSETAAKYYREYYLEAPIKFQTELFGGLQQLGEFTGYKPEMIALHFYSPVFYLLNKFDRGYTYEDCLCEVKEHVHCFCKLYQR